VGGEIQADGVRQSTRRGGHLSLLPEASLLQVPDLRRLQHLAIEVRRLPVLDVGRQPVGVACKRKGAF